MNLDDAFWAVCAEAEVPKRAYVSLYSVANWYGGPEEGGWWGHTVKLEGYMLCNTEQEAHDRAEAVQTYADQLTEEARDAWSRRCQQECENALFRGVEPEDLYGEVDEPDEWFVAVEEVAGSQSRESSRQYC